jgi:glycosyltransferase involved in cell wall biosynthesis
MKLLVVASSLDLRAAFSATPSWWQLLKALAEQGVELTVAPYQGPAIESPWWTSAANPCQRDGDAVACLKRLVSNRSSSPAPTSGESVGDRALRRLANALTKPRWQRQLVSLLEREPDTGAVLFLGVPPNHFTGVAGELRRHFGVPTFLYDGDVPASLPRYAGFRSGFKIYQGSDLWEYEAVISNSAGAAHELRELGARRVYVVYYGADPTILRRVPIQEEIDVFFFGNGAEYRQRWLQMMVAGPSRLLPEACFVVRGSGLGDMGRARRVDQRSFREIPLLCSRSRVNVVVTRQPHATVYGSSTARPFELAALGCAMVSNPYLGVEEWFEPGREILIVRDEAEAVDAYRCLLRDQASRRALGERARRRLLQQHTYADRAAQLRALLGARQQADV